MFLLCKCTLFCSVFFKMMKCLSMHDLLVTARCVFCICLPTWVRKKGSEWVRECFTVCWAVFLSLSLWVVGKCVKMYFLNSDIYITFCHRSRKCLQGMWHQLAVTREPRWVRRAICIATGLYTCVCVCVCLCLHQCERTCRHFIFTKLSRWVFDLPAKTQKTNFH